ncbi:MAG: hypothetical protein ACJ8F1_17530 [Polyangia bacterium]
MTGDVAVTDGTAGALVPAGANGSTQLLPLAGVAVTGVPVGVAVTGGAAGVAAGGRANGVAVTGWPSGVAVTCAVLGFSPAGAAG